MSLKIRLARGGTKKRPHYRIVVADARSPRDGRFIEKLGIYDPLLPQDHADRIRLDADKARWLRLAQDYLRLAQAADTDRPETRRDRHAIQ